MKFSPFIILLIPLWVYISRYSINVIRNEMVSLDYYFGLSGRKRTKSIKGLSAKVFGYSTLIGGIMISVGLISTVFSSIPHLVILYITLCPMGIAVNLLGTILFFLSNGD
jgi:hypothetical protein